MDATLYVSKLEAIGAVDVEDYIEREWQRMQELAKKAERENHYERNVDFTNY